jgi:predicted NAD-dependent protein-ADP-ribosyltransferase YbiA (DUF1768 family)
MMKTKRVSSACAKKERQVKPKCNICGQKHEPDEVHALPTIVLQPCFIGRVVRFSSGSPVKSNLRKLSNFHHVQMAVCINGTTRRFISSEHAYVFYSVVPNDELTEGGALSTFAGLSVIQDKLGKSIETIAEYWKDDMIGVVAKLVGNCARKTRDEPLLDMVQKRLLWMVILRSKFQDPEMRKALLETGDSHLVEYCKGAVRRQRIGIAPERWGGWDYTPDDNSGVCIWGENNMGILLMNVRGEIRNELSNELTANQPSVR